MRDVAGVDGVPAALALVGDEELLRSIDEALRGAGYLLAEAEHDPELVVVDMRLDGAQSATHSHHDRGAFVIALVFSDAQRQAVEGADDLLRWPADEHLLAARLGLAKRLIECEAKRAQLAEQDSVKTGLLANSAEVMWRLSLPELRFQYLSPSSKMLGGWDVERGLERTLEEVFPPLALAELRQQLSDALTSFKAKGEPRLMEVEIEQFRKDGTTTWVHICASFVSDADGTPIAIQGSTHDISKRKKAEDALRASEERYRQLVELAPDAIFVHHNGEVEFANEAAARLMQVSKGSDLVGRRLDELLCKADVDDGDPPQHELRHANGDTSFVELRESAVAPGSDSKQTIVRDVTERRQLAGRLHLIDRMLSIGTLAAGVAHEVNTPLAYVLANIEFGIEQLRRRSRLSVDEIRDLRDALLEAKEGAARVRDIVRDLKTFSRGDEDQTGPVDIKRVLESSINMSWNELRHRAKLYKNIERVPAVEGNESRIGQVFLNLLVNAAQSIPKGQVQQNSIAVSTRTGPGDTAVIEVKDSGVGIPDAVLARIFDPFFTTKPSGTGTGLGLPICRNIVQSLGGEITVESSPGEGTTVRVILPGVDGGPVSSPTPSYVPPDERANVLVVDDDELVSRALRRVLRGHEVTSTQDGAKALELLLDGDDYFHIVLCDLMMPLMSGRELYEQLAAAAPEACERLVFMTGGTAGPEDRDFTHVVGAKVIDKPFDSASVRALVQDALRRAVR